MSLIRNWIRVLTRWDWVSDPRVPLAVVWAMALAAFMSILRYVGGSDFAELALNRLQDDSYYYLQPAWNFPRLGMISFDGLQPTYGFQPLWMLVLSLQSLFTPDKMLFLRTAVALGALFYCLAGLALFALTRTWMPGWRAVIAPALWLFNPPLVSLFITGKENALYAFLLIAGAALVAQTAGREWTRRSAMVCGLVLGLAVLARVNGVVPAALLLGVLFVFEPGGMGRKLGRSLWTLAGAGAVLLPWGMYAELAFGAVFPNSGSAKLIGAWAGLLTFAKNVFPAFPADAVIRWFSPVEQALYADPASLTLPTRTAAESFFAGTLPDAVFGAWKSIAFPWEISYKVKLLALFGLFAVAIVWMLLQAPAVRKRIAALRSRPAAEPGAAVMAALLLAAAINGASNWLLLPGYLDWGTWYAVPEALGLLLAAATCIGVAIGAAGWIRNSAVRFAAELVPGVLVAAAVTAAAWAAFIAFSPRAYLPAADRTQDEVYAGVQWMNENLPEGARVGSYSAGLIGYFARPGIAVINLDGLANTPEFVASVLPGHLLYARGLASESPLSEYLLFMQIRYLANYDPVDRIQSGLYLGIARGRLLYEGSQDIVWGGGESARRFLVVEMGGQ